MMNNSPLISKDELRNLLLRYRRENWEGIQPPKVQEAVVESILQDDGTQLLKHLETWFQVPARAAVLDVGCGVGSFVLGCRNKGMRALGIEPDRIGQGGEMSSLRIAGKRTTESVFVAGVGEKLPFPDASFDLVTMNQVVEHVQDQSACLREAVRVLKPGGAIYIACPNYLRFYEPHYKISWLPLMPRSIGRTYLRLRGRNPVMLSQLTYTTNGRLRKLLRSLQPECDYVDLHEKQFLEKRKQNTFASRKFQIVAGLTRLPILGDLLLHLVLRTIRIREGGCEALVFKAAPEARLTTG